MSDYLNGDPKGAIGIALPGLSRKITVNSTGCELVMPAFGGRLSDEETANARRARSGLWDVHSKG